MNGYFEPEKYGQVSAVSENYTRIKNEIIDTYMGELSDKAFKCLMLIIRYTSGYNKSDAQIATSTFQSKCGIKKRDTVFSAILELEQINLIKVDRKKGVVSEYSLAQNQSHQTGLDQSHETVLPTKGTSTVKGDGTSTTKRDGTSTVKRDSYKETIKENFKDNISCVFEFWKTTFGKTDQVKLSKKRESKIQARLKSGYTIEDLKTAILGCSLSDYHIQNGFTDIELICREPEKTDAFIAKYKKLNPQPTEQKPQAQARVITRDQLEDL